MQLVADVDGYHHLVCLSPNKNPLIYVFNAQLQFVDKKELALKLQGDCDVRILPFHGHYFLYFHTAGNLKHEMYMVRGNGTAINMSFALSKLINSVLKKSTATLQLVNQNDRLFLLAHTYYDDVKKIESRVIEAGDTLNDLNVSKLTFSFDRQKDMLQQVTLTANHLLVLKSVKDIENGNSLELIKANLRTGYTDMSSFNSGSNLYVNAGFRHHTKDSTILIYSLIREPAGSANLQRTIFIERLDHSLQQITPVTLLRRQFRNNTTINFLLAEGAQPYWLSMGNSVRLRTVSRPNTGGLNVDDGNSINLAGSRANVIYSGAGYRQPHAIRFTILDDRFRAIKDSLVVNNGNVYNIQPQPFAQFELNDKAYLLLVENFSAKQRGLLLVHADDKNNLITTSIPVYARHEYLVTQLQTIRDEYFILPYTNKSEIGLVKIPMKK